MPDLKRETQELAYPDLHDRMMAGAYTENWPGSFNKIRGSVNKAPLVFQVLANIHDPRDIPVSRDELNFHAEPYLVSKTFPAGCKFKTPRAFYNWWSNYGSFCDVATGRRSASAAFYRLNDDWAELIACLSPVFNVHEMTPIVVLVRECRREGIALRDLTAEKIVEFSCALSPAVKKTIKEACPQIDGFRGGNLVPAELLPIAPIGNLPVLTCTSARQVPAVHPDFTVLMDDYLDKMEHGRKVASFGTELRQIDTEGVSPKTLKNIRIAVRWFWQGTVVLGINNAEHICDIAQLTQPILLHDIVRACEGGQFRAIASEGHRRDMLNRVIQFLDWLEPGYATRFDRTFFQDKSLSPGKTQQSADRSRKQKLCLDFISRDDEQRRFFTMPRLFFDEAVATIADFSKHSRSDGNSISMAQHRAMDLAIMAALTAINTRFPARLDTLHQLESSGAARHLFFPENAGQEKNAMLHIPGYIVKNGHYAPGIPLIPSEQVNPRAILTWYLKEAHPLILKYKVGRADLRRPNLLFAGLHIDTVRGIWRRYIAEAGLGITPHMPRHLLASLLLAEGVDPKKIAELLGDEEGTIMKSYIFIDRWMKMQGVMSDQAAIYRRLGV